MFPGNVRFVEPDNPPKVGVLIPAENASVPGLSALKTLFWIARLLPNCKVPAEMFVVPVNVLLPVSVNVPLPSLVNAPAPLAEATGEPASVDPAMLMPVGGLV